MSSKMNDLLRAYFSKRLHIIPVPLQSKAPTIEGWPEKEFTINDFSYETNVGLVLGNLVDVDVEISSLGEIINLFLDSSCKAIISRGGKKYSHFIFATKNGETTKTIQWKFDNKLLVEIRTGKQQTIIPPSIHPSGEELKWLNDSFDITEIEFNSLVRSINLATITYALSLMWIKGYRQNLALYASGWLLKLGYTIEEVERVINVLGHLTQDEEIRQRVSTVKSTYKKLQEKGEKEVAGSSGLIELLGKEIFNQLNILAVTEEAHKGKKEEKEELFQINGRNINSLWEEENQISYIVENLIPRGSVSILAGSPKVGKSLLGLQLLQCIAENEKFLDMFEVNQSKVIYVDMENGRPILKKRLEMIGGPDIRFRESIDKNFLFLSRQDIDPFFYEDRSLKRVIKVIESIIATNNPEVVLFDTLYYFLPQRDYKSKESDYEYMYKFLSEMKRLAEKYNTALIFIHHYKKNTEGIDLVGKILGTTGIAAVVDVVIGLQYKSKEDRIRTIEVQSRYAEIDDIDISLVGDDNSVKRYYPVDKVHLPTIFLGEAERKILKSIVENSSEIATVKKIKDELSDVSESTIKWGLNRLCEKGFIKKLSWGKYILNPTEIMKAFQADPQVFDFVGGLTKNDQINA